MLFSGRRLTRRVARFRGSFDRANVDAIGNAEPIRKRKPIFARCQIGGTFLWKLWSGLIALTIRVYLGGVNRVGEDDEKLRRKLPQA